MNEMEQRIHNLEKEFRECRDNVGERMLTMEQKSLDQQVLSVEKLTRLETQMIAIAASLSTFVTASRFRPVELIAFGLAGGVMTTALGVVLAKSLGALP